MLVLVDTFTADAPSRLTSKYETDEAASHVTVTLPVLLQNPSLGEVIVTRGTIPLGALATAVTDIARSISA